MNNCGTLVPNQGPGEVVGAALAWDAARRAAEARLALAELAVPPLPVR